MKMGQYVSKAACYKRKERCLFGFIAVSAEATAPTAGEIENCTLNRTLFAVKWKGNWLNLECILIFKVSFFGKLQKARS